MSNPFIIDEDNYVDEDDDYGFDNQLFGKIMAFNQNPCDRNSKLIAGLRVSYLNNLENKSDHVHPNDYKTMERQLPWLDQIIADLQASGWDVTPLNI